MFVANNKLVQHYFCNASYTLIFWIIRIIQKIRSALGSGIRASSRFFSSKANTPKLYENAADVQKLEVLKENKGKSGVYLWINNINLSNFFLLFNKKK